MNNVGLTLMLGMGQALAAGLEANVGKNNNPLNDPVDNPFQSGTTSDFSLSSGSATGYNYNSAAQKVNRFNFFQSY